MAGKNAYAARLRALAEDSGTLWLNDAADEIERLEARARARERAHRRYAAQLGRAIAGDSEAESPADPPH